MQRKRHSLRFTLFVVILSVAVACITASVVLAMVLAAREVNQRLDEQPQPQTGEPKPGQPAPAPQEPRHGIPPWLWVVFLLAGITGLIVAVALSLWMARRISRPISDLTRTTAGIAEGKYGNRVEVSGGREIEELGRAFNLLSEKLARNEALRKNMVADIAHELRTPLTTLRCDFEAVRDGVIEPGPEVMENLMGDIVTLTRLVDDLQQLSLADAEQLSLEPVPMEVEGLIDESASRFSGEISEKKLSLEVKVEPGLPRVVADRLRVSQVLGNLIKNSLLHAPEGGKITISASDTGSEVTISVIDDGPGISREELPFIFERFYRADPSRMRATGGSGLGLAIARALVTAHGGRIWAESEPGRGTTVSLTLPAAPRKN